jgi:hypothetical protein
MVEYHFIQTGLQKGEYCVYTIHKDDISIIESGMADLGIDVEGYKKNKLLHIYRIAEPQADPQYLLHQIERLRKCIMADSKPPVRFVSRWMKNVEGEEDQQANLVDEQTVHSIFEKYQGSVICSYPVKDIKAGMKGAWMQNHLKKPSRCDIHPQERRRIRIQFACTIFTLIELVIDNGDNFVVYEWTPTLAGQARVILLASC